MPPEETLETFCINPGPKTKLSLQDFDFLVFAFLVLAASTACRGLLCDTLVWQSKRMHV